MNETTKLEIIGGFDKAPLTTFQPSALEAATKERDRLLDKNKAIVIITNAEEATLVARALKANKAFVSAVEDARTEYKAPVLALGRRIDAVADALTSRVQMDVTRFGKLHGAWQADQNRLAEEAKIKAYNEEIRLREEAAQREADAREAEARAEKALKDKADAEQAERDRIAKAEQDALEAKARRARTEDGKAKAEKEAQEAREKKEREDREREVADALAEEQRKEQVEKDRIAREAELTRSVVDNRIQVATSAVVIEKPAGISTRKKIEFTVTDIAALYKSNPMLVKLTPETALIKAALKNLPVGGGLPGVKHWEEHVSHGR